MDCILAPEQMRLVDAAMTKEFGIPPLLLMENAARSAAELIVGLLQKHGLEEPVVHIFCGAGNNGGDGFAIARHLYELCYVRIFHVGDVDRMTEETRTNYTIARRLGIPVVYLATDDDVDSADVECDVAIDALMGVGGSEYPRGTMLSLLLKLAALNALAVAIDVPTGMNAATGACHSSCFCADYTIVMQHAKTGMYLGDADDYCGEILVAPFGVPEHLVVSVNPVWTLTNDDVRAVLPPRKRRTSKHDYGSVLVVGGAQSMPGAPVLAAHAALSSGAGRVRLLAPVLHPLVKPEIMTTVLPATDSGTIAPEALSVLLEYAQQAQAVVFGPGLGSDERTIDMGREFVYRVSQRIPVVVDADGLRCVSADEHYSSNVVLTPHYGEFARLIGTSYADMPANFHELAVQWAQQIDCTLLLKQVPTVITDGETTFWNTTGNPGMATAGSGDVLSGIIGGLLAQGVEPLYAAALGAWLHARAGDIYAERYSQETLTAGALIDGLAFAIAGETHDSA